MKKIILLAALLPSLAFAFPVHTNLFTGKAADSVPPTFDAAVWDWSGFDDQKIIADFSDVTFSNAGLRLSYPMRGNVYLDMSVAGGQASVLSTAVVTIVNETFTNCYARVPASTNYWPAWSNVTVTTVIRDTGTTTVERTSTASGGNTNAVAYTGSPPACVVYVASNYTMTVPDYGIHTSLYYGVTSIITYATAVVETANLISNGTFASGLTSWVSSGFAYGGSGVGAQATFGTQTTARISQLLPTLRTNGVYGLRVFGVSSGLNGSGYEPTNTFYAIIGVKTTAVQTVTGFYQTLNLNFYVTNAADAAGGGYVTIVGGGNTNGTCYFSQITLGPYSSLTSSYASVAVTNIVAQSNVVRIVSPSYTRVNAGYSSNSVMYQRLVVDVPRSNIPPDGLYYAEVLAYENTTNQARSILKGQVTVSHSLYANTNIAAWVSPALGATLVNGYQGELTLIPGANITFDSSPTSITITATGSAIATNVVDSLSVTGAVRGALTLVGRTNVTITQANNVFTFDASSGTATLPNVFTGDVQAASSAGGHLRAVGGSTSMTWGVGGGSAVSFADGASFGGLVTVNGGSPVATGTPLYVQSETNAAARLSSNVWVAADSTTNYVRLTGDTMSGQLSFTNSASDDISIFTGHFGTNRAASRGIALQVAQDDGLGGWINFSHLLYATESGLYQRDYQGNTGRVFSAINDGVGSTADADFLDGLDSLQFLRTNGVRAGGGGNVTVTNSGGIAYVDAAGVAQTGQVNSINYTGGVVRGNVTFSGPGVSQTGAQDFVFSGGSETQGLASVMENGKSWEGNGAISITTLDSTISIVGSSGVDVFSELGRLTVDNAGVSMQPRISGNAIGLTNLPLYVASGGSIAQTSTGAVLTITGGGGGGPSYSRIFWGQRWEGSVNGGWAQSFGPGIDELSTDSGANIDQYAAFIYTASATAITNELYGEFAAPATNANHALRVRANQPGGTVIFTATDGNTTAVCTQVIAAAGTTYTTNVLLTGTAVTNVKVRVIYSTTNAANVYRLGIGR